MSAGRTRRSGTTLGRWSAALAVSAACFAVAPGLAAAETVVPGVGHDGPILVEVGSHEARCPDGTGLVGLRGHGPDVRIQGVLTVVAVRCATDDAPTVDGPSASRTGHDVVEPGDPVGDCPAGMVSVGIEGRRGTHGPNAVALRCQAMTERSGPVVSGAALSESLGGVPQGPFMCPAGEIGVGVRFRDLVDLGRLAASRIDLICDAVAFPPETSVAPVPRLTDATPTFSFAADEPGATFECRIAGGDFAPCTSPHTTATLAEAGHTFEVRACNSTGCDPTPAARSFRVCSGLLAPVAIGLDPILGTINVPLATAVADLLCLL